MHPPTIRIDPTRASRTTLGAVGISLGLWGLRLLLQTVSLDALIRLPLWLGGAILADDLFLIPLTVGAGWLLTRWSTGPGHHRTVTTVRITLLYVGLTTLIALPLLMRQGKGVNPTVLPRDRPTLRQRQGVLHPHPQMAALGQSSQRHRQRHIA
jgi:hypothetical protein